MEKLHSQMKREFVSLFVYTKLQSTDDQPNNMYYCHLSDFNWLTRKLKWN